MPNMASTPSAFKHSMIASTARIVRPRPMLASRGGHLLGPFLVRTAAVADLLVERDHVTTFVTFPKDFLVLVAPQQCSERSEDRQHESDREPEQERAALVATYEPCGQATAEADEDIGHPVHSGLPLEDPDCPDDRDEREYYDDHGGHSRHDADHDLEKNPGSDDQDEDRQHAP